ncbi:hypothetical protein [Microviridae sp.]|nr:hypothetical protein [Microviridae sp.]UOF82658.1 hypothetical protein [Microviridae sp.]UOF82696.1 hypothetical protein [Microviridae sp.]
MRSRRTRGVRKHSGRLLGGSTKPQSARGVLLAWPAKAGAIAGGWRVTASSPTCSS